MDYDLNFDFLNPTAFGFGGTNAFDTVGGGSGLLGSLNDFGQWGASNMPLINAGVGGINALANLFSGFNQMGLYKDQLRTQKDQWNKNYENQVKSYNYNLQDKQRQRIAGNPTGNLATPEEVLKKWGV